MRTAPNSTPTMKTAVKIMAFSLVVVSRDNSPDRHPYGRRRLGAAPWSRAAKPPGGVEQVPGSYFSHDSGNRPRSIASCRMAR